MHKTSLVDIVSEDVVSAKVDESLEKLKSMMDDFLISHIPIVSDDNLLMGIVSRTDLRQAYWENVRSNDDEQGRQSFLKLTAQDIMHKQVVSLKYSATIIDAIDLLSEQPFHSLPVVSEGGYLKGMITCNDLLAVLRKFYQ